MKLQTSYAGAQDGEGTIEVSPKEAVRIIDEALGSMSPGAANTVTKKGSDEGTAREGDDG